MHTLKTQRWETLIYNTNPTSFSSSSPSHCALTLPLSSSLSPHRLQSQGEHDHDHGKNSGHSGDLATAFDGVWKGLTALAGIYLLFIIEHCIGMFKHYKDHEVRQREKREGPEMFLLHLLFLFPAGSCAWKCRLLWWVNASLLFLMSLLLGKNEWVNGEAETGWCQKINSPLIKVSSLDNRWPISSSTFPIPKNVCILVVEAALEKTDYLNKWRAA